MKTIRWGIISTGGIANVFASDLQFCNGAELGAVASRDRSRARGFAKKFKIPRWYGSYEELAADPEIDVVYVATPHPFHKDNTLMCLHHGKAVLCEKPLTINAHEAHDVIALARERHLFLMEAMWTRFFPITQRIKEWLERDRIGKVRMIQANFGLRAPFDPESRLYNPHLGGGALLDVGIYPLAFTAMMMGTKPSRIQCAASIGSTGVDEQNAIILTYGKDQLAVLTSAVATRIPQGAIICGTRGNITIDPPFFIPTAVTLEQADYPPKRLEKPVKGHGYEYEAHEVCRCLRNGLTESPLMPLDESLALMQLMDTIRAEWKMKYPGEK